MRFLGLTGHHDPAILLEAMRRFAFDTLLVACRTKAIASSSAGMPAPSSLTRIEVLPAPRTSMLMRRASESRAFSTSSLTTDAGRSITSPAAIASATSGARRRIASLKAITSNAARTASAAPRAD